MALEKVLALDASGVIEKSINVGAPDGSMVTSSITLTSGQTSVPIPGGYISGGIVVFLNGVYLSPVEYTATDLSNVVLAVGAPSTGSVLDVMVFSLQSLLSISSYMLGMLNAVDAAAARTLLALGTAATANKQTSTTDTTAGALMVVGAYGAGAAAGTYLFGRANILGTVSQSAGVPTGALMEYGSNANGEYWRYAGGMQVCAAIKNFASANTIYAAGSLFYGPVLTLDPYPAAFVGATPSLTVSSASGTALGWGVGFGGSGSLSSPGSGYALEPTSGNRSLTVDYVAVGRWF